MHRNKLYLLLSIACVAGYAWLFTGYVTHSAENSTVGCLVKHVTGIPCPSCGSTRSVLSLLQGNIWDALQWNPLGIILFLILAALPVWLAYDVLLHKSTLHRFYHQMEITLRKKEVAIPAILLVTANWIWNIYKGL